MTTGIELDYYFWDPCTCVQFSPLLHTKSFFIFSILAT